MKTLFFSMTLILATAVQAAENRSQMVIEEVLFNNQSADKTVVMSCVCYRGPGQDQPYTCQPVAKTCYGGPGYYPYTCYVCP